MHVKTWHPFKPKYLMDPKTGWLLLTGSFGELAEKNTDATLLAEKKNMQLDLRVIYVEGRGLWTYLFRPPWNN